MSGVAGGDRIERKDVLPTVNDFKKRILSKYPDFAGDVEISGSYNSNKNKNDFGDVDLIVTFTGTDKKEAKAKFTEFLSKQPSDLILPFMSQKYKGKKYSNTGELVSVRYPIAGNNGSVQIDIIFAMDEQEKVFKQKFLDLPAEKQGLILGLIKTVFLENSPEKVFKQLGIPFEKLASNEEYEFTLSSSGLTLDRVKLTRENGKIKSERINQIIKFTDWNKVINLLSDFKIENTSFEDLIEMIRGRDWKEKTRAIARIKGLFKGMVSIKSGEVGTAKGERKQETLNIVGSLQEGFFKSHLKQIL